MKYLISIFLFFFMILFVSSVTVNAEDAEDDLIAYYKFDGNLEDEMGLSDGDFGEGGAEETSYMEGYDDTEDGAILFGAGDDTWYRIDLGTYSPSQEGTEDELTCAFWGYWNGNTGSWQDIINKREHFENADMMWGINQHDATDDVLSVRKNGMDADFSEGMPEEEWTHVAITMDNEDAQLFINGVLIDSKPYVYGEMTDAGIYAGTSKNGHVDAYNGALDDLRFYTRVLTEEEVESLYNCGSIVGTKSSHKLPVTTLAQNFPDPFNSSTTIEYTLTENTQIEIAVYDLDGHKAATLVNGYQKAGTYKTVWDASGFSAGVYIYQLKTTGVIASKKMRLIR